jgi:hypothetical protein
MELIAQINLEYIGWEKGRKKGEPGQSLPWLQLLL